MRKTSTLCAMCQPQARKRSAWECRGKRQCRTSTGDEFFHFRSIIILYLSLWVHEGHIRLFKQPKLQSRWPIQLSSGYWITGLFPIPTSDMMLRTLLLITRFWMVPGIHKNFSVKRICLSSCGSLLRQLGSEVAAHALPLIPRNNHAGIPIKLQAWILTQEFDKVRGNVGYGKSRHTCRHFSTETNILWLHFFHKLFEVHPEVYCVMKQSSFDCFLFNHSKL